MTNIFGWLGHQEQRKALNHAKQHIDKVRDVVYLLRDMIEAFLHGDQDAVRNLYEKVESEEHQADIIRRELLNQLSEGLFMPPDREDLVHFVERMDDIADYACAAARLIILLDPQLPSSLKEDVRNEARLLTQGVDRLREAIAYLYRGEMKEALHHCNKVEEVEEAADRNKGRMYRQIFRELDLDPKTLLLMHDLIEALENTADMTEDTADQVRIIAVKYRK